MANNLGIYYNNAQKRFKCTYEKKSVHKNVSHNIKVTYVNFKIILHFMKN